MNEENKLHHCSIILAAIIQSSNAMLVGSMAKKFKITEEQFLAIKAVEQYNALVEATQNG